MGQLTTPTEDISLVTWARTHITGRNASHELNSVLLGYLGAIDCFALAVDDTERRMWLEICLDRYKELKKLVVEQKRKMRSERV